MKKLLALAISYQLLAISYLSAQTGTWTAVHDTAPHANYGVCLLMTDGTVICHSTNGNLYRGWDRLTPDIHGSYANGTWDTITSSIDDRLFFSSQVLPDGRVYTAGGEYGGGGTHGEVYNPATNQWTACGPIPSGWNIYDGNSEILYNGTVLEGPQIGDSGTSTLIWSPVTNNYVQAASAYYGHDEASWLKLRDSSVLYVGIGTPWSNRYIPQIDKWVLDDTLPGNLYDPYGYESGPACQLPNGKDFFTGATGFNAIYTPSGDTNHGTWAVADSFPMIAGIQTGTPDATAAMMVNGHVLISASPIGENGNEFRTPAYFVEYDYTTNKFTQVTSILPGYGADSIAGIGAYQVQMLNLPDGTILVSVSQTGQSKQYYIYTPGSGPIPQGKPTIDNIINLNCNNYKITGKLFNGISEGSGFGDDWQMETNYPLVRLTDGTNVYYAKTTNWNRIGTIQTDSLEDTAYFTMPSIPGGTYSVVVTANGFASNPVLLTTFGVSITSHTNLSACNSGSGSATAFASNGATPYTYQWSPSGGTNPSASGLSGGTYTITVTENGGCTASASVTISQAAPLSVYTTTADVTCNGGSNGEVKAWVNGGTQAYTYLWNPGSNTNALVTGLGSGTYTVLVTDSCGNTATATATVNQPNVLTIAIDSSVYEPCNGDSKGKAFVGVNGGTAPYAYYWTGGSTTDSATGLSAGSYTITVSDYCGNSATARATITQPTPILNTITAVNCKPGGGCDGEASVTVSGGTSPYTYFWIGGGQTTDTIKNHCPNTYCVRVTDNHGCYQIVCVDILSDIENITSGTGDISVYPNPSNGRFAVEITNYVPQIIAGTSSIEIYNVLGEKVYSQSVIRNSQFVIDLSSKSDGVYFYRVLKDDGSLIGEGKLIIQK